MSDAVILPGEGCSCFGSDKKKTKSHWLAAKKLYNHGVWIGFLDEKDRNKSYEEMPSFKELLQNSKNFQPPYPPVAQGLPSDVRRQGACRSCVQGNGESPVVELSEIQFDKNPTTKLTILPVSDGTNQLFAILIPEKNDRSTPRLSSYRPWALDEEEDENDFFIVTVKNTSSRSHVYDVIRESFRLPTCSDGETSKTASPQIDQLDYKAETAVDPAVDTNGKRKRTSDMTGENATHEKTKRRETRSTRRTVRDLNDVPPLHTAEELGSSPPPPRRHNPSPSSKKIAKASPKAKHSSKESRAQQPPLPQLEESQPHSIDADFIWSVNDGGEVTEFVHSLAGCSSLDILIQKLQRDARFAKRTVSEEMAWKAAYQLQDGSKKAVFLTPDNKAAFSRLLAGVASAEASEIQLTLVSSE